MFVGTATLLEPSRAVCVETFYLDRLDSNYLSRDCFSIIVIKRGSLTVRINDLDCHIPAPAAICLDEHKRITILSNNSSDVMLIKFNPKFLNVNLSIPMVRSCNYEHLCQQHAFFQLSPFLTNDISKMCIKLNEDTLNKIEFSFNKLTQNLKEQADWYWSCRARAYFIDIINILERIYHNYFIEEPYDACIMVAISSEFKQLLSYVNNHLDKKITLSSLYATFRINKNQIENLFKEFLDTSFYDYLRKRRFEEATYYLRFTGLDGEQIAERIGLSSSQNFCKFFKAMSGMTPNSYRKEVVAKRKNDAELVTLAKTIKDAHFNG